MDQIPSSHPDRFQSTVARQRNRNRGVVLSRQG